MTDTAPFGLHRRSFFPGRAAQAAKALKIVCYLLIVSALAACGGGRPGYTTQQQPADGLTITLERPQQAQILKDYELFVSLNDAQGKPVDNAIVFIDIVMPTMSMGTYQPLADPLGNGQYRIKGVFTMEGDWRLTVHAKVAGQDHAATFDQPVTPAP